MLVLSQIDYGYRLLTMSKMKLTRLCVIRNVGMKSVLGCAKDTSAAAIRYLLGLPPMVDRYRLAKIKTYLNVCADKKHPLHEKIDRQVRTRLKRGMEWMTQAAQTIE